VTGYREKMALRLMTPCRRGGSESAEAWRKLRPVRNTVARETVSAVSAHLFAAAAGQETF
jgi:hypothetical protein